MLKNPDYRLSEERQQLVLQAASEQKQIEYANKTRQAAQPNDPARRPCDERQRLKNDAVGPEMERGS